MEDTTLKQGLQKRGLAVGTWVQSRTPVACEAAGAAGFDFVIIDLEHGNFGLDGALEMVRACESRRVTPVIRVAEPSAPRIKNALDLGVTTIMVPSLRTAEEAAAAVRAAKFEPEGGRGACPWVRCANYSALAWPEYLDWCDRNRMVWAIIENPEAVKNVEAIAASGVDALMMGPFDLSMSLGLKGQTGHPEVVRSLDRILAAGAKAGVDVGCCLFVTDPKELQAQARAWKARGVRIFTNPSEGILLYAAYRSFRQGVTEE